MSNRTLIIAEAGVNHNGHLQTALQLIDAAADAGADIVKFQTFKTEQLVSASAKMADYQVKNTGADHSQYSMLKNLELSEQHHHALIAHCNKRKIKFLSTAFDLQSLDFLSTLNLDLYKIPSGEITNLPYLHKVASFGRRVILSTGMCTMEEISDAVNVLLEKGIKRSEITILHCNTEYPTPFRDVNLLAMNTIREFFGTAVGYSDHTTGIEVPVAAVALGAAVIEKHFTLDKNMEGPDHLASVDPGELSDMVRAIRNIESALGSKEKKPSPSEIKNIRSARKSIHLAADLEAGTQINAVHLSMKRPGDGISPMKMNDIIGRRLKRAMKADEQLKPEDLQ
jgi:N,N'-diacetyllegionaminate synthase